MPSISLEYKESWPTYEVSMTLCCNPYNFLVTNYFEVEDAVYPFFPLSFSDVRQPLNLWWIFIYQKLDLYNTS